MRDRARPSAPRPPSRTGRLDDLEAMGFGITGYGCATCIGNSGPPLPAVAEAQGLGPVAVLSGNRNFPGRAHPQLDSALLASPPLVAAYAIAGRAGLDITRDPLGSDARGDTPETAWDLAVLALRAAVPVTLRRAATGEVLIGPATALAETARPALFKPRMA
jgi:hypothetical protein